MKYLDMTESASFCFHWFFSSKDQIFLILLLDNFGIKFSGRLMNFLGYS